MIAFFTDTLRRVQRWTNPLKLRAVHDDDLENMLGNMGVHNEVVAGSLKCWHCQSCLTLENLAGWRKTPQGPEFFCDNPECLLVLTGGDDE